MCQAIRLRMQHVAARLCIPPFRNPHQRGVSSHAMYLESISAAAGVHDGDATKQGQDLRAKSLSLGPLPTRAWKIRQRSWQSVRQRSSWARQKLMWAKRLRP